MKFFQKRYGVVTFLNLVVSIVAISLFFKAIIDVDKSYDTWMYHVPFAARLWGIIPRELHIFYDAEEARFAGFPVLVEFLQGFFWFITGRVQAGNLVDYLSLGLYCFFLKAYFQVPLYLSAIAFLAVPLVQVHVTSSYVDLPGGVCLSILIMMTYLLYIKKGEDVYNKRNLFLIFLAAAGAANIKFQLVPLVVFVLFFALFRIIWLRWQKMQAGEKPYKWLLTFIPLVFLTSLLIFATPIKNVVIYGNPFYPIKIEVAGAVLNHQLGFYQHAADSIKDVPQVQRWLYSILEINAPRWSIDQWSPDPTKSRLGGFFGAYVVFHLLLLGYLFWRNRSRETTVAIALLAVISIVTAIAPQSHELRYYLYWMILLVSLNLYLVTRLERSSSRDAAIPRSASPEARLPQKSPRLNSRNLGLVCLVFLSIVIVKTNFVYVTPNFYTLDKHLKTFVNFNLLRNQIQPGDARVCLVNRSKQYRKTFLYSSYFHPQLGYSYSIKSALDPSECREITKVIDVH
ncbi:hypothetical protein IQ238_09875 [Pleurocapsales cyanobacterium LEGE 06147]|nr:hypothetical protein [Pleurocapsales cyanobacterium LEGE 06147]